MQTPRQQDSNLHTFHRQFNKLGKSLSESWLPFHHTGLLKISHGRTRLVPAVDRCVRASVAGMHGVWVSYAFCVSLSVADISQRCIEVADTTSHSTGGRLALHPGGD